MTAVSSIHDIRPGDVIPVLRKIVDRADLVRYAGASDDYIYLHWDRPRVQEEGFPDVVIHGWLTFAYMCQAVSAWIPRELADMQSYSVRYLRTMHPGIVDCSGRVLDVEQGENGRSIQLELWATDADGQVATSGKMRLVAPPTQAGG
jgi:acyl dehydratase